MNRGLAGALLALAGLANVSGSAVQACERLPNIIMIVADDLGYAELGCYGQKWIKTPHLDQLAAQGMRWTHFYAGSPVCAPSRCALLTGKHTGHATIRNNRQYRPGEEGQFPLRPDDVTLTTLLQKKGYVTAAMGKWGLGNWDTSGSPLKHGFDYFFGYNCQVHAHSHYPTYIYRNGQKLELPGNDGKTGRHYTHDLFEAEALAFVEKNKDRPFFLYLPFTLPHVAIQVPEEALEEYRGKLGDDPPYDGGKGYQPHPAPRAGYAAMVSRLDRSVGRIVARLRQLGLDKHTLVIFTSDNGPTHNVGGADSTFFQSAGKLRGLKGSLYEGGIRVPFIAWWPGVIAAGTTCSHRFYFPDVLPTLCDVVGLPPPVDIDGLSFWPTLCGRGTQKQHEFLYWEFPGYGGQQAIIAGSWKAVRQNLSKGKIRTELYHLEMDEAEQHDVATEHPDIVARLERLMQQQHRYNPDFPLPAIDTPVKK
ncbi:MAG: arylsulfatase [Gemmataceae bacterium]|nr:arylsulfatase [Gemmataceae bacterium]